MRKYLAVIVMLLEVAAVRPAWSLWPDMTPLLPFSSQFCGSCVPAAIGTVNSTIEEVRAVKDRYTGAHAINMLTQSAKSYLLPLGGEKFNFSKLKSANKKKVISYSRTIEDCTIAGDISDEEMVKSAFMELFLQYPSKKNKVRKAYSKIREQFKIDTTLEIYITAREMNKELQTMLAKLNNIERCLVAGEDCTGAEMEQFNCQKEGKEDEVCLWRNALNVARIYDQIMRYNEFLQAMNAQYDAVKSIGTRAPVKEYKKSDKQSSLMQQTTKMVSLTNQNTTAYAAEYDFDTVNGAGVESPMETKLDDFHSLPIITEIKNKLNEAVKSHNFKRTLPEYLKVFEDYHEMEEYHQKTVDNLLSSETCIMNNLEMYYKNGAQAWLGTGCKKNGSSYECPYAKVKSADDTSASYGDYDTLCADDKSQKCYVISATEYDKRGGISGWILKLYDEAKALELGSNDDIYVTSENDSSQGGLISLHVMKKNTDEAYQNNPRDSDEDSVKNPAMEDDIIALSRKEGLINWVLGAEASKVIADDLASFSPLFGTKNKSPLIWNDQKNFYDMYIDGKYANIKNYIQELPLLAKFSAKMIDINNFISYTPAVEAAALRKKAQSEILTFQNLVAENPIDTKEIDSLLQEETAALQNLAHNQQQTINNLNARKKQLYDEIAKYNEELTLVRDAMNESNDDIDFADATTPKSEDGIEYGNKLKRGNADSLQFTTLKRNIGDNKNKKSLAVVKRDTNKLKENMLKAKIKSAKAEVEKIAAQIEKVKANYIKDYSILEYEYKVRIDKAVQEKKKSEVAKVAEKLLASNEPAKILNAFFEIIRQYAIEQVNEAEQKIQDMKASNQLYYASNSGKVAEIHLKMLENIQKLTLFDLLANEEYAKTLNKIPAVENLFDEVKGVFSEIFTGKETPDTEYFVGIVARERDLQTPKQPPEMASAISPREVFHFDLRDFGAVEKYFKGGNDKIPASNKDVTLVGASFLDSGLDIPQIWRHILKHRAFVERDIDFEALLNKKGNAAQELLNSGIYPCTDGANSLIMPEGTNGYVLSSVMATEDGAEVSPQPCQVFEVQKSNGFATLKDKEAGVAISATGADSIKLSAHSSELGQILDYVDEMERTEIPPVVTNAASKKLTFRQELLSAMKTLSETESLGGDKPDEKDARYYKAERVQFNRNQFGDYLDNVGIEKTAKDTVEQLAIQVADLRLSLKDMFEQLGYTLSDDFDMTNIDDYNQALEVMEKHKNDNMKAARDLMATLKGKTDYLAERIAELEHGLKVLETDSEEQTTVALDDDLDELEEKIKNSAADKDVVDVYSEEGRKSFKQQIERLRPPYCAVYMVK